MNITQIENNLKKLTKSISKEDFIFDLLLAYGLPKASITRLKKGNLNLSKADGEVSWKKRVFFKEEYENDLHLTITDLLNDIKHDQRFVIVTDYKTLLAVDTKNKDKLDIEINDLHKHYDFFLPWAGMEKAQHRNEHPADVKAAERMAKLYDEIKKNNPDRSDEFIHSLNVFLSRLLFCFFAEDTNIFKDGQFINAISSHTQLDGSDLNTYLDKLFDVLNTPSDKRKNLPAYLDAFPYVNGGLFKYRFKAPVFTRGSRKAIVEAGELDWSAINPDIFGSMMQAVIRTEDRGGLGIHYTSVPNIMKVIQPLFLNELYENYEEVKFDPKKLNKLLYRLSNIKIFDPACGSGNFLIIAYKELRKLEIKIIQQLQYLKKAKSFNVEMFSRIHLSQFHGIELDDFAQEITQLSLWLAQHQMNVEFKKVFGRTNSTLPLKEAGKIVQGNACRIDWQEVCPRDETCEIYILGNPPYLGARMQEAIHKADMDYVFSDLSKYRDLDYISCWFYKGAEYIKGRSSKLAFVSTNSICQGLQVSLLWPNIFSKGIEINFTHQSFKWGNNAKHNAAVIVVIIGLSNLNTNDKKIYLDGIGKKVNSINAYLSEGAYTIIKRRSRPLSFNNEMSFGNMPNDGGGLILSSHEKEKLVQQFPEAKSFVKKLIGASEFIRGGERYCLWIDDEELEKAKLIPFILERIECTKKHRIQSKDKGTNELAKRSHQFRDTKVPIKNQIIMPSVSSERREYIPCGFLNKDTVISNSAQVIYDAEPWLMGVLSSKMHMVWISKVGGKLEMRYRYAKDIVYNTFPFPDISDQRKQELTQAVFRILEEREKHSDKTLAQLYDPDIMPDGLREAHHLNDLAIERCYRTKPFENDEERLKHLFKLYEKMIANEQNKNTLFEKQLRG